MLIPLDASLLNNPGSGFFVGTLLLEEQENNNVDKSKKFISFMILINIILNY